MSKPNSVSTNVSSKAASRWDEAIRDAEGEILALSRQRARLQQAVRIFKANRRERVKWRGDGIYWAERLIYGQESIVGQSRIDM
jgi:hypothetical protein